MGTTDLAEKFDRVAERVRRATLPLFKPSGHRQPELIGCSVAVRLGDDHFLFTARHVVVDLKMTDIHVWTPGAWILAGGEIARTNPSGRRRDRFDAAVIRLNSAAVNDHVRNNALRVKDLDLDPTELKVPHLMQLVGYPGGEVLVPARKTISPSYVQWVGTSSESPEYVKRGYAEKTHALFRFDRAEAMRNENERHPGPDMHGASGSGIWRHLSINEGLKRNRLALLSAIFTDYEGRTIVGTRVVVHMALASKYFSPRAAPA